MKVVEGTFGKAPEEEERTSPEGLLEILKEELDLSKLTDMVIMVGDDNSFSFLTNMSIAEANLLLDKTKFNLTAAE